MKMKYVVISFILIAALLTVSFLVGTGLRKRSDVVLVNYSVSADGTKLTIETMVPTSMGYIRGFENKGGGLKPHYLVFYSTFGGLSSSFGAKSVFELDLSDETEVYFNRPGGGYALVLQKNPDTGLWEVPKG